MQRNAVREAKSSVGRLIGMAHAEPAFIEKHGRAVVVIAVFEGYEQLAGRDLANEDDAKVVSSTSRGKQ